MTLYMIGLGLNDEKDITVKGLEAVKKCDSIYLESYTSLLQCTVKDLEKFYGKKIIIADRELVEKKAEETILKDAKEKDTAFLVVGDVFGATTHTDIKLRALDAGIKVKVINNTSILNAIGITGLELYKFGKVTSIPFNNKDVETPYEVLEMNKKNGMHTLFLLDLNPKGKKFLTIKDAINYLFKVEKKKNKKLFVDETNCVGCSRLGSEKPTIKFGYAKEILNQDFGKAPYCLIIPGDLHFMEEDALEKF